jgi:hypothetical protein
MMVVATSAFVAAKLPIQVLILLARKPVRCRSTRAVSQYFKALLVIGVTFQDMDSLAFLAQRQKFDVMYVHVTMASKFFWNLTFLGCHRLLLHLLYSRVYPV